MRIGVREVARIAGVSAVTVWRVLSNHPNVSDRARRRVLLIANCRVCGELFVPCEPGAICSACHVALRRKLREGGNG